VDHWLHALAILDALHQHDRMNRHEPEDLHGDVRDLDQTILMMRKMKKAAKMKCDLNLVDLNLVDLNLVDLNLVDLNLVDLNLVGSMGVQLKKDDQRKRDGWMDGQN
jgi:hypothetical protein